MVFCRHCGKLVDGGRFCSACGGPIAPDALDAMAAELNRHRNQMRLIVIALGLVFVVTMGLIVSRVMLVERTGGRSLSGDETSAPVTRHQQPLPTEPIAAQTPPGQPPQQLERAIASDENNPTSRPSLGSIDPKAVQNAFATLAQNGKQRDPSPQQLPASSAVSTGSDRYPGSEPLEVKDANLPDIGIPVVSEVYTTTDSLPTVLTYYTQRYSDAEVMEVNGQKIIAVNRPGAIKVIAIGTTGEETRIAVLKPVN